MAIRALGRAKRDVDVKACARSAQLFSS
jgi:hypothetical protein